MSPEVSQELADHAGEPASRLPHASKYLALAAHSVSDLYPTNVVGVGNRWQAWHYLDGRRGPVRDSYAEAEEDCLKLKDEM